MRKINILLLLFFLITRVFACQKDLSNWIFQMVEIWDFNITKNFSQMTAQQKANIRDCLCQLPEYKNKNYWYYIGNIYGEKQAFLEERQDFRKCFLGR